MFSNLFKVMFSTTGFLEEQEATTKSTQNKDVHFLGGNQTQRHQYSNSIVISVYSGGPSPAHYSNSGFHRGLVRGPFIKMNRKSNYFTGIGGWGGYPSSFFLQKSHLGKLANLFQILGQPQAEIAIILPITCVRPWTAPVSRVQVTLAYSLFSKTTCRWLWFWTKRYKTTSIYIYNPPANSPCYPRHFKFIEKSRITRVPPSKGTL